MQESVNQTTASGARTVQTARPDHPIRYKLHETLDAIYEVHDPLHKDEAYALHCQAVQLSEQLAAAIEGLRESLAEALSALRAVTRIKVVGLDANEYDLDALDDAIKLARAALAKVTGATA